MRLAQHPQGVGELACGLRRKFGQDAAHRPPGLLQQANRCLEPGPLTHRHPQRRAILGARLDGEVQLGGVVKQAIFERTFEHRAQARCAAVTKKTAPQAAPWQLNLLPRQPPQRHQRHHLAGARQQRQGYLSGIGNMGAVKCKHIVQLLRRSGGHIGQGDNEGAHGQKTSNSL